MQRSFGLVFHDLLMDKLPWDTSDKSIRMAKIFPMQQFMPTMHQKGYKQQRPLSHVMTKLLPKEHRDAYRCGFRRPKSVSATSLRVGQPPREHRHKTKSQRDGNDRVDGEPSEVRVTVEVDSSPPQNLAKKKKAKKPKTVATEEPPQKEPINTAPSPPPTEPKLKKKHLRKTVPEETPVAKKTKKSKKETVAESPVPVLEVQATKAVHKEEPSPEVQLKRKKKSKRKHTDVTREPTTQRSPSP
ncbi:hypothetical protein OSB04_024154 [Centaurea solstitialis]|uniref:Uncharacterized protein n=1 Tax=Centaurea solstitialis TaxID=347529 RepID=A0AA38W0C8_9ASTR|nr:hypothetical protein OSB04_024154 [Centaurea solstitialis]